MAKRIKKLPENEKEKALLELMQDIHCLDVLQRWTDGINIFHVLKIARTEIRHSNMLAWLLDPNENHGLGTSFLRALITDLSKSHSYGFAAEESVYYDAILTPKDAISLLSSDLTDTRVYREWNHIDILLKLPKGIIVAIENKVDAAESTNDGKSQLTKYRDVLNKNFEGEKILKLYLTPNGDSPSQENQDWKVYTYFDILSILTSVNDRHSNNLSVESQALINNYIDVLNNEIMDNLELKSLCNEIYKKHKLAFDTIFEYKESATSMAADICFRRLTDFKKDQSEIEIISQKSGVNIQFSTPGSRHLQSQLKDVKAYYQFVFKPSKYDGVSASCSLTLNNLHKKYEDENAQVINNFAVKNECSPGKDWEWKGIWGTNQVFEVIDDTVIGNWVAESCKKALAYESDKNLTPAKETESTV